MNNKPDFNELGKIFAEGLLRDIHTDIAVAESLGFVVVGHEQEDGQHWYTYPNAIRNLSEQQPLKNYSGNTDATLEIIDILEKDKVDLLVSDPQNIKLVHNMKLTYDWLIIIILPDNQFFAGFGRTMSIALCQAFAKYQNFKNGWTK